MNHVEEKDDALLRLQQEIVELREKLRRQEVISEKMAEEIEDLRSALHKVSAKCHECESRYSDPRLLKEEALRQVQVQGTASGKLPSAGAILKRQSENDEDEPPRKHLLVPLAASKTDVYGRTELHRAAKDGDVELLRELLDSGFDTRAQDRFGATPLHEALYWEKEAASEFLINADDRNAVQDEKSQTPLHLAAEKGFLGIVRMLVYAGADMRLQDRCERTPLHCALCFGTEAVAEFLVDADNENDMRDKEGNTPLHLAAEKGYSEIVRKLVAAGANTRLQEYWGETPLHRALICMQEASAEILVDADCPNDIEDEDESTPLHHASKAGYVSIVKKLLLSDAHPHVMNMWGIYPLCNALSEGHYDVVRVILAMCLWRDIAIDWEKLYLPQDQVQRCIQLLSECRAEIQRMKDTKVCASKVSYFDVTTQPAGKVTPYLPKEVFQQVLGCDRVMRDFPNYNDLIAVQLRRAEERRVLADKCLEGFSRLFQKLPPLPLICVDIILLCLSNNDLRNFISAMEFES